MRLSVSTLKKFKPGCQTTFPTLCDMYLISFFLIKDKIDKRDALYVPQREQDKVQISV